jgi:LmbE family N-acetylglucosaminyl deacetylase
MPACSRRAFIASSLATLPALSASAEGPSRAEHTQKLHVVCVGGHPDTHLDHQVASLLTFRAVLALRHAFPVFYFEVNAGDRTRGFVPTIFVDIGSVRETRKRALVAHVSQDGDAIYRQHHEPMEGFRGREAACAAAEACARLSQPLGRLPIEG